MRSLLALGNGRTGVADGDVDAVVARGAHVDGGVGGEYFSALSSSCRSASLSRCRSASTMRSSGRLVDQGVLQGARRTPASSSRRCRGGDEAIAMNDEVAGIDAKHLNRVGDQGLETDEIFVDDRDQLASRVRAGGPAEQERRCGGLHRSQRRLELVRRGVQHRGTQLAALARRLGARVASCPRARSSPMAARFVTDCSTVSLSGRPMMPGCQWERLPA